MKAAIYVRISTSGQMKGTSLEEQISLCKKRAKELGYSDENIDVYREEAFSGSDVDIRPEMNDLRSLTKEGAYKHVICTHPDRFSRDLTDKLIVCRELEKNDAELEFTDTEYERSPEGALFFNIMSAIAAYELELIKKRTVRGRLARVKNHKEIMPMRVPPYGYDWKDKQLTINEEEAEFVRKMYEWYVYDKLTLRQIGEKLYQLGAYPKRKERQHWNASSISRVLASEIYTGKYYYNRREGKKVRGEKTKSGNAKITRSMRDEEDWIMIEVPHIVDEALWNMAQSQRKNNRTNSGNSKNKYLLKSLLVCKNCGRKWSGTTYTGKNKGERVKYRSYRCPNKNPKKYGVDFCACKNNSIRADIVEDVIWEAIVENLIKKSDDIKRNFKKLEENPQNKDDEKRLQLLKKNLESKEEQRNRIKKMFQHGMIEEEEMIKDMRVVKDDIQSINYEIEKIDNNKAVLEIRHKASMFDQFVEGFQKDLDELTEDEAYDYKRNFLTTYVEEIIIDIDEDDGLYTKMKGLIQDLTDGFNVKSSTHRFDDVNTTQRMEILLESGIDRKSVV